MANLPDFVMKNDRPGVMSAAEMLKKIKQDELARVNNKFGKPNNQ